MLKKGEHIEGIPTELETLLFTDEKVRAFFESLSKSYKQGYCDWVRAAKALIMLQNEQKTLKT